MLKKRSFLIISTVALLVLLLSGCSADTANGKIEYDHVAMPEETDPYYIIGFADYVFIGSIFLESLYAKTEFNDANYQKFIDYVANETGVDRERFNSSFEIDSD